MGIAQSATAQLHLGEHHGDSTPGLTVRICVDELEDYHRELCGKGYRYERPDHHLSCEGSRRAVARSSAVSRAHAAAATVALNHRW